MLTKTEQQLKVFLYRLISVQINDKKLKTLIQRNLTIEFLI